MDTPKLKRVLGLFSCTMLVVGNMIGVGIFTTPGRIGALLPSSTLILSAWVLGAFLAIAGAFCYAELGAAYPEAGGNYDFLREAYGPLWAFVYGWTGSLITQSGTAAVLAVGFTKYAGITEPSVVQATAVGLILIIGCINYLGVQVGAGVVDAITVLKILAILGFAACAALVGHGSFSHLAEPGTRNAEFGVLPAMAMALVPIMYAYSGWNSTVYVGSEVKDPQRIIPISLIAGVLLTAALYLLLNVVYLYAMPAGDMGGVIAIAREACGRLFSPAIARTVSFFIAFSVLGCLNAHLLTSPRIPYAMAKDGRFFPIFARVNPRFSTPGNAILLVTLWAAVLALWGGQGHKQFYRLLDDYVTVPSLLINALTVMGLYILRRKKPALVRPYLAWGYPWTPALFAIVVLWMVASESYHDPVAAAAGIGMMLAGIPFFWFFRRSRLAS